MASAWQHAAAVFTSPMSRAAYLKVDEGSLVDVQWFPRALTDAEVAALYAAKEA